MVGEVEVKGVAEPSQHTLKGWIKNEHMACWIDGKPAVLPPDLKAFLDPRSRLGITSDKLSVGREIAVVGAAIDGVWRSGRGLQLFGPRHFGLNYDYVPFENLH